MSLRCFLQGILSQHCFRRDCPSFLGHYISHQYSHDSERKKVPLSPRQHRVSAYFTTHHISCSVEVNTLQSVKCEKKYLTLISDPWSFDPCFFYIIIILWKTLATAWISGLVFPRYGLSLFPFKWSRTCVCCFFFFQFGDTFLCPFYNSASRVGCVLVKPFWSIRNMVVGLFCFAHVRAVVWYDVLHCDVQCASFPCTADRALLRHGGLRPALYIAVW